MKLTVFGATGGTGSQLVRQASEAGHAVTAVVRDPARLAVEHPNLTVVRAELEPAAIGPAIEGQDAVVTAIGARGLKPTSVCTDSTASIAKAMAAQGVRRLVAVSNSGMISGAADGAVTRTIVKPLLWRVFRNVWRDAAGMEDVVRASGLDWTIVRPPRLTNGPRTGAYRTAVDDTVPGGQLLSRADLADYILRCLREPDTVGAAVALAR